MGDLSPPAAILDDLYEATTNFEKWPVFLRGACDYLQASASHLVNGDYINKEAGFSAFHGIEPIKLIDYAANLDQDPRLPVLFKYPGKPMLLSKILDADVWKASGMYRNVFQPADIEHSISVTLPETGSSATAWGLFRPSDCADFTADEVARFGEFIPHLKRAVRLQKEFAKVEETRWSALAVLDDLPMGVIVTDAFARVLFANTAAKAIAKTENGLSLRHGELWADELADTSELRALIERGANKAKPGDQIQQKGITLARRGGKRPLYAKVMAVSVNTVRTHVKTIYAKLHISSQTELVKMVVTSPALSAFNQNDTLEI